jgi:signal transduction histidine kinase
MIWRSSSGRITTSERADYGPDMAKPTLSELGLVGVAAAAAVTLTVIEGWRWIEATFLTIVFSAVLLIGRMSWRGHRDAVRERRTAADLQAASPEDAAREAVVAERRRLSADIEACVRDSLMIIDERARGIPDSGDPAAGLRAIQSEARRATSELRRQLGLLRSEEAIETGGVTVAHEITGLRVSDLAIAGAVVAVAGIDLIAGFIFDDFTLSWVMVTLTVCAAATVVLRRIAPQRGALLCAAVLMAGAILEEPAVDGFWFPLAVGIHAWTLATLRTVRAWLTLAMLSAAAISSRLLNEPANAPISAALLAVAVAGGATVGHSRRARAAAQASAAAWEQVLQVAAQEAVAAERRAVARELHDLVSSAISVIAVQAGAAELTWANDPAAARRSVDVVRTTAEQTLAELDRLLPGTAPVAHDLGDLEALLDRVRAAGLSVGFNVDGCPPDEYAPTVYRIVQEGLTNVLRHAPGSRVTVRIVADPKETVVEVADDGPGPLTGKQAGYGLIGLAERVKHAGGTFEVRSAEQGTGLLMTVVLPNSQSFVKP